MNEQKREEFLERFSSQTPDFSSIHIDIDMDFTESTDSEDLILIGFCVLGGIFSEGIDLKRDSLIGAIVVGTGLPQICFEREILKNYFDEREENGFDYAYRFPGMNKVLQAAGRVIRTAEDVGIIALLDERFVQNSYKRLFPKEWENYEVVRSENISKKIEKFWDSWL
ncbi:MAG: helicase C-terminal domain-containing protein [Lachnospiraceae bacterium]